ncbi:hypothetical protein GGX14DRAFT_557074 [Mycena pura]|uniref:Uncharacterized protein n=1 Tax=Mycena pura TaxID=153505 RepID=A0AAD6YMS6_9AGAR|nr:hypothetical protein GGX14DRAFT_557074 [Mycena pura]
MFPASTAPCSPPFPFRPRKRAPGPPLPRFNRRAVKFHAIHLRLPPLSSRAACARYRLGKKTAPASFEPHIAAAQITVTTIRHFYHQLANQLTDLATFLAPTPFLTSTSTPPLAHPASAALPASETISIPFPDALSPSSTSLQDHLEFSTPPCVPLSILVLTRGNVAGNTSFGLNASTFNTSLGTDTFCANLSSRGNCYVAVFDIYTCALEYTHLMQLRAQLAAGIDDHDRAYVHCKRRIVDLENNADDPRKRARRGRNHRTDVKAESPFTPSPPTRKNKQAPPPRSYLHAPPPSCLHAPPLSPLRSCLLVPPPSCLHCPCPRRHRPACPRRRHRLVRSHHRCPPSVLLLPACAATVSPARTLRVPACTRRHCPACSYRRCLARLLSPPPP